MVNVSLLKFTQLHIRTASVYNGESHLRCLQNVSAPLLSALF